MLRHPAGEDVDRIPGRGNILGVAMTTIHIIRYKYYRALGNEPDSNYSGYWSIPQNREMWSNWKRISDRPLEDLLPPEWELIEIDPEKVVQL